jgi:hypothetical protein
MTARAATIVVIGILLTAISLCGASAESMSPNNISDSYVVHGVIAPPCTGRNPHVAVPSAPHGMFVWLWAPPPQRVLNLFKKYVIGKDPSLCGASEVVNWSDVENSKGSFDFSKVEQDSKPFVDAGLTVNLLFAAAGEGDLNTVTPPWVMAEVPATTCGGVKLPVYWNSKYEADWSAFISYAIDYFSNRSPIKDQVGYMRFAIGAGAEAVAPPGAYGNGPCAKPLRDLGYSYEVWKAHSLRILDAMASVPTTRQIVAALPSVAGGKTIYDLPNAFAAAAAAKHVGLSFESLGVENVAAPGTIPGRCDPNAKLHWCPAYIKYAGVVPLAMQPITASRNTNHGQIDISNLLQYALANKIQIFELYPDEWLEANGATDWQPFEPTEQAKYKAALHSAALVLGAAAIP